ncbi:MAG TPA: L,D-transpeptidase [Gemmatimonadales bacterium]|nr:L,D-transpeptidase [Gemmatimonadales bacterium]
MKGPKFGRLSGAFKALAVLGVGAVMLGAHHNRDRAATPQDSLPVSDINAGVGPGANLGDWAPERSFRLVDLRQWGGFAALDSAQRLTILKINRVDEAHARRRALVVPDRVGDELSYSPFPATVPALLEVPKFIVVSRRVQAFGAYEYGRLVRWGPTSTGKATTPTDSGLFFTNWKSRQAVSTEDPSWILDWYVNFIALKGVAFHQYSLPGRPASHGCVRLLEADAYWIYQWAAQWVPGRGSKVKRYGTPVLVMGDYDYRAPAPWMELPTAPLADQVSDGELADALAPELGMILARTPSYEAVPGSQALALAGSILGDRPTADF